MPRVQRLLTEQPGVGDVFADQCVVESLGAAVPDAAGKEMRAIAAGRAGLVLLNVGAVAEENVAAASHALQAEVGGDFQEAREVACPALRPGGELLGAA
ncbi:MAG: hypothetical protein AW10_03677 [Candidatus Accumulibacter appositus]|uniref:Uncharacterized protein n=1 Tax=Candidatus Accumulibacter appositus TaxID=1454003 RepID=A0A011N4P1_9PROT|nr:MAG: hypothetical protein AW10_03677 [Candidatus Accumulibacter appositus]